MADFGQVSVTGFAELQRRFEAVSSQAMFKAALEDMGNAAVREAKVLEMPHRKTGNLGRSIRVAEVTLSSVTIEATAGYARFVELGTRAHIIRPKNGKVLAWGGPRRLSGSLRSGGKPTHFATIVHHPGTKPSPFLLPGAERAYAGIGPKAIVAAWNRAA